MRFLRRGDDPRAFPVTMIGPKMGDRLLQLGAGDGALLAALGAKVGLTGRACGIDETDAGVGRAEQTAAREGVLLELQRGDYTVLPFEPASFDLAILNGVLRDTTPETRVAIVAEITRVLRPGGRCIVVDRAARGGLAGLVSGPRPDPTYQPEELLRSGGFRAARQLGEGNGYTFVEGFLTRA